MSVQVRRRRESAAFLKNFVGAGGELLVDTTNNRVQVHDGVTPGGWPTAAVADLPGRNAVVNGSFAVNQRGYGSGTALGAGAYGHDRWKAGSGGCTYGFTQAVPDTAAAITAGSLVQVVEGANVTAPAMWLSWTGTASARAYQGAASSQTSPAYAAGAPATVGGAAVNALALAGLTVGANLTVEFANGGVGLVQLEAALPNAGPTRFERRHPSAELALCQRYYNAVGAFLVAGYAAANGQTIYADMIFPVGMRAAPTIAFANQGYSGAQTFAVNWNFSPAHARVQISSTASGQVYGIADILFSAEL